MAPPPPIIIDAQAVSGITGSISLACWIIVFAPQIYENFSRKSSEGLSLSFLVLWLIGDVFNILGAVLQHVLPTMIILAVYYTLADVVLLWQCLAYRDRTEIRIDASHLSPAKPLGGDVLETVISRCSTREEETDINDTSLETDPFGVSAAKAAPRTSTMRSVLINTLMVVLVISSGLIGWALTLPAGSDLPLPEQPELVFDPLAQFFGWLCAIFYLGSRIPQIVLNYKRKSCEGISFMFFLFACLGNMTYTISILCISTSPKYILINGSWLSGSIGTLGLDLMIFAQFFMYSPEETSDSESEFQDYGSLQE
ncbi:hypothetical protein BABINDRAFT_161672 [Babjeviella inositovora NRRL Y-12698]|uniref:PQ-loop-domain-containing protein n=1 Tax=Babjeviella inositovora NRRL Y-12698 TaxID=984486 RepID=A0A1E3QQU7_9ASCO|nr:uncharacterized protein BABINDRAFT_161672 [Babjeviella inositovora NRRL Y-12698]ODQ80030.1 hypothetical protein BABINDRAFT_161672 [Babjeviella inositovora NRRL Y-12698]